MSDLQQAVNLGTTRDGKALWLLSSPTGKLGLLGSPLAPSLRPQGSVTPPPAQGGVGRKNQQGLLSLLQFTGSVCTRCSCWDPSTCLSARGSLQEGARPGQQRGRFWYSGGAGRCHGASRSGTGSCMSSADVPSSSMAISSPSLEGPQACPIAGVSRDNTMHAPSLVSCKSPGEGEQGAP